MTHDARIDQLQRKRRKQKRSYLVFVILWTSIIALGAALSTYLPTQWDVSREKRYSLTDASQLLLQNVDAEIRFTAFSGKNLEYRRAVRSIVEQYKKHHDNIRLEFVDPNQRPDLTREYGIRQSGEIRLSLHDGDSERSDILRNISETSISNAIMRLSREQERFVLFISGHGERNPFSKANHDMNQFAQQLTDKGYVLQYSDLASLPVIPDNVRFVVIASPQLNYLPQEVERLQQFIVQGGSLLWMTEPDGLKNLDTLLVTLGLKSDSGTVIDPGTQALNIEDASFSLISNYNQHPALDKFDLVSLFPQSRAFETLPMDSIWMIQPFLVSSERTWLETETLRDQVSFSAEHDTAGPLNLGMSLQREFDTGDEQRILVIGDGDFLSNRFLNNGANIPLGLNLFDWLSGEDGFLDIHFAETPDVSLSFSERQLAMLGLLFLVGLPVLCFSLAAVLWWRRRIN